MTECPICGTEAEHREDDVRRPGVSRYDCPNCGRYQAALPTVQGFGELNENARAVLSHEIWKHQDGETFFSVQSKHLEEADNGTLPNPAERLDSYILFIGSEQKGSPGTPVTRIRDHLRAKIGALRPEDVNFITKEAEVELVERRQSTSEMGGRLTMKGWQHYEELLLRRSEGKTAFMAMPYGNAEVSKMVEDVFKQAVKETGFHLKRLDDETPTGLIDNRMRVEIRMCRFLIADLTCENRGAYWEAGFAEGLGRPVIYTCSKAYFEKESTHFDTNHQHTIQWDPNKPDKAAEALKATIRDTFPFEAKMPDESESEDE